MNKTHVDRQDDETQLIVLAQSGDVAAFGILAIRHQDRLYRFLMKTARTPADARDLTQEALLQAFRCLATFNGAARFSTWLTGIALNLSYNDARRASKCTCVEFNEENMADLPNSMSNPAHHYQQKASLGLLACAIEAMPADMRKYVQLISLDGHSYEDVAQLLKIPLGTVKSGMSRARQLLRCELTQKGFF